MDRKVPIMNGSGEGVDKLPYSTIVFDRFPNSCILAYFPTPAYSWAQRPDSSNGASPEGTRTPLLSPNSHALLLLCFSIGYRASISPLWTNAVPMPRG